MPKVFHVMEPPPPEDIPIRVLQLHETLNQMPKEVTEEFLDALVGAFTALSHTYDQWMRPYLGDLEPDEIIKYGPMLDGLDTLLIDLSDALLKQQDGMQFMRVARLIITLMQDLWSMMLEKGFVK